MKSKERISLQVVFSWNIFKKHLIKYAFKFFVSLKLWLQRINCSGGLNYLESAAGNHTILKNQSRAGGVCVEGGSSWGEVCPGPAPLPSTATGRPWSECPILCYSQGWQGFLSTPSHPEHYFYKEMQTSKHSLKIKPDCILGTVIKNTLPLGFLLYSFLDTNSCFKY